MKPAELLNLNIYPDLKYNILNYEKNCKDPVDSQSYYCLKCKESTCPKCTLDNHKGHLLIQREKCLKYDNNFFDEIDKNINQEFDLGEIEDEFIREVHSTHKSLSEKLSQIKEKKIKEINNIFSWLKKNINEVRTNYEEIKKNVIQYYQRTKSFFAIEAGNMDVLNTIFLMNFELMNLCDNKNLKVISTINSLKSNLEKYKQDISEKANSVKAEIEKIPNDTFIERNKFDDFYWDVQQRITLYEKHINNIKMTVANSFNNTGDYSYLEEIVQLLDSKNKRGIDYIFNQAIHLDTKCPRSSSKEGRTIHVRGSSSRKLLLTPSKTLNQPQTVKSAKSIKFSRCNSAATLRPSIKDYTKVSLDNICKQKFFCYSIIDIYNKYFTHQPRQSFCVKHRVFGSYKERTELLKEIVKPIPQTNELLVYNLLTKKTNKVKVPLSREKTGYILFPDGTRHILIEQTKLYVTGGIDACGKPLHISIMYNLETHEVHRLPNMINPHSYHAIELLDNYDCFIVVGGVKSQKCEMYDYHTNKWTELPDLNSPRSNISLYFDQGTSEVFAFFGMTGNIAQKNNYSDVIEVLELNDLTNGWIKIDYYKSAMIDLKMGFINIYPLTKGKLLLRGVKAIRGGSKTNKQYAVFDMDKNEIVSVTQKLYEKLKEDEHKIKSYSNY